MAAYLVRKRLNELLNRAEFRLRRTALRSYPVILFVEATNRCPLRCPLCATGAGDPGFPRGEMALDDFARLLAELGPRARTLHLYNWGEPLLHRGIWNMVRMAKGYGLKVWLSSTLNVLDAPGARELVASGLDRLSVSIDGVAQETYARYRLGGELGTVMRNLRAVLDEKARIGGRTPRVTWQFLAMRHNEPEIGAARAMAESMGVGFVVKPLRLDMRGFGSRPVRERAREDAQWLPEEPRYNRYRSAAGKGAGAPCRYLWDRVAINWNGAVAPCCRVFDESDCFGSVRNGGFGRIWNGPAYRHARGIFSGSAEGGAVVCDRCVEMGNTHC